MNPWLKIRRDLYLNTRKLVAKRLGEDSNSSFNLQLRQYEKSYQKELSKKWKISSKEKLVESARQADVLLLGDFHALHQSQKAHIRILRELHQFSQSYLALECFFAEDQIYVDQYQKSELSEKEFLKKIQWSSKWGFPWGHYRKIVHWAIKHRVPILALNHKTKSLKQRDEQAARLIYQNILSKGKKALVIYGDFHLAKNHLPQSLKRLKKKIKIVRVFQNPEELFFKIIKKKNHLEVDLIQDDNDFCLLSVPPWVKWQNYLLYLDEQGDRFYDEEVDFSDRVFRFVDLIAQELDLKINKSELSVFTFRDDHFWKLLSQKLDDKKLKFVQKWIEAEQSFYLPELKVGYLARASVNHMSWLSMQFIMAQLRVDSQFIYDPVNKFESYIWLQTLSYFGNKICNPKKKSDTLLDFKLALMNVTEDKDKKEAYRLALTFKLQELLVLTRQKKSIKLYDKKKTLPFLLAGEMLGGLYGEKLYFGWSNKLISANSLRNFMIKDLNHPQFKNIFVENVEFIESLPEPFRSKKDKL